MILRTTFTDGETVFEDLGDQFFLTSKQRCSEKFQTIRSEHFQEDTIAKDCFAFISPLRMERFTIPLYTDYQYVILSERGCEIMKVWIGGL